MMEKELKKLDALMEKYSLSKEDQDELKNMIEKIVCHEEFQKRTSSEFPHHDKVLLGEHILEDTIVTYILSKKYEHINYNKKVAVFIALFHDLYTEPWQNNPKSQKFPNKHGFRHPIEAIISAVSWFPEYFENLEDAKKIIDGVLHHMYPLPVRKVEIDENNSMELNNFELVHSIPSEIKELIIWSGNRCVLGNYSISPSLYKEGRVMSQADRFVTRRNLAESSMGGILALVTGKNKHLN